MAREELDMNELDSVAGGNIFINTDTKKAIFSSSREVVTLVGDIAEIKKAIKGLEGSYKTGSEFDAACMEMLIAKGYIKSAKI